MIDTHVHCWWPGDGFGIRIRARMPALDRDFRLEQLPPSKGERVVLVSAAQEAAETERLFAVAARHPGRVAKVVGFVDPDDPAAGETLASWQTKSIFAGLRFPLVVFDDPGWLERPATVQLLDQLEQGGHIAEILAAPGHLAACARVLSDRPGLRVLLDHAANPPLDSERIDDSWADGVAAIAALPNAMGKLGDLRHADRPEPGDPERLAVMRRVYGAFGPERVVWGSNWPVSSLHGEDGHVLARLERLASALGSGRFAEPGPRAAADAAARRLFRLD